MTRIRLQITDNVGCRHAGIKRLSIGFGIDTVAIAIADVIVKLASKELLGKWVSCFDLIQGFRRPRKYGFKYKLTSNGPL
jgi:hypothetical protein